MHATASGSHLLQNYNRAEVTFVRGEGCELIDEAGDRYIDLLAGIAVCALGHCHPDLTAAIAHQAATLVHVSNYFHYPPTGELADVIARESGFDRVFFCNSGTEANEAAIKMARKFAYRAGEYRRTKILAARGSFHGRTFGALAATDNPKYQEGFAPLPGGFAFVDFNDPGALDAAIDAETAAFIVEPVQGESGVKPATRDYLEAARLICDERGALLIFDEVQCGMGRLGTTFAFEHFGVRPDAITLAKALANGLPVGALVMRGACADALRPGDHGTTFGGSPVPCAAALEHFAVRERLDLNAHVRRVGPILLSALEGVARRYPALFDAPRGLGLMLGLPVRDPYQAADFFKAGLAERVVLNAAGGNTLRFVPPLIIDEATIAEAMRRFGRAIERVAQL